MCGTRDNVLRPKSWDLVNTPCRPILLIQGVLTGSHDFGWRTLSRVPLSQFIRELFLHLAVLLIFLQNSKQGQNYHFYFRTIHPRGGSHLLLRCCFGSLHAQQLHGFDELRNDQGIIQNRSVKLDKWPNQFICPHHIPVFDFFD
jgi:hypothetical protein